MVDSGVQASIHKNLKTTLPRIDNYISEVRFKKSNLVGKLYPSKAQLTSLTHWALPEEPGGNGGWENYSFDQVTQQDFTEAKIGDSFGPTWSTHWFKVQFTVSDSWIGYDVRFRWMSGSEATVWTEDGIIIGGLCTGTARVFRPEFVVAKNYDGTQKNFTYYIEMVCGQQNGASDGAEINPPDPDKYYTLTTAEIVAMDTEIYKLVRDLEVIYQVADQLTARNSSKGYIAMYTGNQMINHIIAGNNQAASDLADSFFAKGNGQRVHTIAAIAQCHIDCAWLWPLSETKRKVARSYANQMTLLEDYPEMTFVASQAQQWAWCKEYFPELYGRIKNQLTNSENFLPVGSVWVEMDGNIPSGESFVRQFLFGQKFYQEELGFRCKEFWLPDTFGYSAQIPGLMRHVGLARFLTKKMSWNLVNKFPHHNFTWEGIDGSSVLAHFPPGDANMTMTAEEMLRTQDNLEDKGRVSTSAFVFGFSDGGGGPTQNMLERARRLADIDGCPKLQISTPDELFTALEKEQKNMCRWVGELYLEFHNGTYTTHASMKKLCRECEFALRDCEFLLSSAISTLGTSATSSLLTSSLESLEVAWKKVLFNQFHDVLPGTSIDIVYDDAMEYFEDALLLTESVWEDASNILFGDTSTSSVTVAFNTLQWQRREVVKTSETIAESPTQPSEDGSTTYLLMEVAPFGYGSLTPVEPSYPVTLDTVTQGLFILDNGLIRAQIDSYGKVTSLKVVGDEKGRDIFAREDDVGNKMILFDDEPLYWDAWDVADYYLETGKPLNTEGNSSVTTIQVIEEGPMVVKLRWSVDISDVSSLTQDIEMRADTDYLIFSTSVDWHEDHKLLKMALDTNILSRNTTFDIQFGQLQRPNHMNTSWDTARYEVCGHKWADLSEPDWGVTVLNNCKYGWYARGGTIALSLLRSPKSPDTTCDMGNHVFKYAIMPHEGTLREAEVVRKGYEFNNPLRERKISSANVSETWAPFEVQGSGVVLHTIKPAQDYSGDIILRFFECDGRRSQATVKTSFEAGTVKECNGLEDEGADVPFSVDNGTTSINLTFTPFQIRALRIHI